MSKTALDGTRLNAFGMAPESLTIVGLDTSDGPEHPLWDERVRVIHSLVSEEFIKSILRNGVLEPVIVRKNGDRAEIVAGRCRVYAARQANARLKADGKDPILVPTIVKRGDDASVEEATIAENEIRTNDSAVVRVRKMQRMLDRGRTEADVAAAFGVPVEEVRRQLPILDLDDRVQKMIADGRLAVTTALTLVDLTRDEQFVRAEEYAASGVTAEEAKRQTKIRKAGNGQDAEVRASRPSTKFLRSLTEDEEFLSGLSSDARDLLYFVLGEKSRAQRIKGLTAKLKEAEA